MVMAHRSILTTLELAARWTLSRDTVMSHWRQGLIPPPFNAHQARGFRWHVTVIERHELGETTRPYSLGRV